MSDTEPSPLHSDPPRSPAGDAVISAMLRLQSVGEDEIERARRATGLSRNEFHAVRALLRAEREGSLAGPKQLGEALGLSNAAVTSLIDRLAVRGLVRRVDHPSDRRAQLIQPTPKASLTLDDAYEHVHGALVAAIDEFSDEDAAVLARLFESMIARLG